MPSLQTALSPEIADNVIRLYRECLRRARFVGHQQCAARDVQKALDVSCSIIRPLHDFGCIQHNTKLVVDMVRQQFKKNMHETDPEKIQKLKDDAARGLINHMLFESEKMMGRKFSSSN